MDYFLVNWWNISFIIANNWNYSNLCVLKYFIDFFIALHCIFFCQVDNSINEKKNVLQLFRSNEGIIFEKKKIEQQFVDYSLWHFAKNISAKYSLTMIDHRVYTIRIFILFFIYFLLNCTFLNLWAKSKKRMKNANNSILLFFFLHLFFFFKFLV